MKQTTLFLVIYLFLIYFMLGIVFCYQLGKTHSFADSFTGLWDATKTLIPVFIGVAVAIFSNYSSRKKCVK